MLVVALVARYVVQAGEEETVELALRQMIPRALSEEGCVGFAVFRSQERSEEFLLMEEYDSEASLLRHRETPHFKEIIEGLVVPRLLQRERAIYHPVRA